jgi:hypothetical protein
MRRLLQRPLNNRSGYPGYTYSLHAKVKADSLVGQLANTRGSMKLGQNRSGIYAIPAAAILLDSQSFRVTIVW